MDMMTLHRTFAVTVPAGEYVLGDPCYSVPSKQWGRLLTSCAHFQHPIGHIGLIQILGFHTLYGDGLYPGPDGSDLGVDSGLLGLVPADMPGLQPDARLTYRVRFAKPAICESRPDGVLVFGRHRIPTAYTVEPMDETA